MMRTLGLSALAAGSASAIMLPPNMAVSASKHGPGALGAVDPFSRLLEIKCPGCQYAQPDDSGKFVWTQGVENSLFANISVGSNPETLELNGVRFYPPQMPLTASLDSPYVLQAPSNTPLKEIRKAPGQFSKLRLTGWSFLADKVHVTESGEDIVTVHLSVKAVEQKPVEINDIAITALKNKQGHLMLLKTEQEARPLPSEQCKTWPLLCQWRATLNAKLEQMRGKFRGGKCHKHPHGARPSVAGHSEMEQRPHHPHGHRPHPHKGHHHHRPHNRALGKVAKFLLVVVIPLLVGTLVGMLVYALGLLIGSGIALLWVRLRGRRNQYSRIALDEDAEAPSQDEVDEAVEKEVVYFDAPPEYIEVEAKEVGSK